MTGGRFWQLMRLSLQQSLPTATLGEPVLLAFLHTAKHNTWPFFFYGVTAWHCHSRFASLLFVLLLASAVSTGVAPA
jgi:hypothetical protein